MDSGPDILRCSGVNYQSSCAKFAGQPVIPLRDPLSDRGQPNSPPGPEEDRLHSDGVNYTALLGRFGKALAEGLHQPQTLIRHHQANTL